MSKPISPPQEAPWRSDGLAPSLLQGPGGYAETDEE